MTSPWRRCAMPLAYEHAEHGRAVLARHGCVKHDETRYHSGHLFFTLDLAVLPPGDGPCVEGVLRREIERR